MKENVYILFFTLPFTLLLAFIIYRQFLTIYENFNFKNWKRIEGRIIKSQVNSNSECSYAEIEYEYSIDGKTYKSTQVNLGSILWPNNSYEKANSFVEIFKVNETVNVFYNPKNHNDSCLMNFGCFSTIIILIPMVVSFAALVFINVQLLLGY